MTHAQIAARLRGIAAAKPSDIWRQLHDLAAELEQTPEPVRALSLPLTKAESEDLEALIRATQPSTRRHTKLRLLLPWGQR